MKIIPTALKVKSTLLILYTGNYSPRVTPTLFRPRFQRANIKDNLQDRPKPFASVEGRK